MKAVLVSFFDSNNIGDLLISDSLYKRVSHYFDFVSKINYLDGRKMTENEKIEIDSFTQGENKNQKSLKTTVAEQLVNLKLTPLNYLYLSKIKNYNLVEFEDEIKEADVLIIGGGNMIFDIFQRTLVAARFNTFVEIAKKYDKKIFAMSLGIGPFQTKLQERKAVEALAKCDYVTFRDQKSYNIYRRYQDESPHVSVAIDPVFSLPKLIEKTDNSETVGVNIINNPEYSEDKAIFEKVITGYLLLIEELTTRHNKKVKLFSTETRDYEIIEKIYEDIENKSLVEIIYINNVDELLSLYNDLSLLIGARMHSMIIAYTQMVPVVGLSWQPKVRAMFDIINEPENCFNLTDISEHIDEILETSLEKINNNTVDKMEKQLKVIQEKEVRNEEILNILSN